MIEEGKIKSNKSFKGDYYRLDLLAPMIAALAKQGQFVHLAISGLRDRILRRPFSIFDADGETISIIFKRVGQGTEAMASLTPGQLCSLMGPLGKPFSPGDKDKIPIIIAGGYGSAATHILAKRSPRPGIIFMGAKTASDLILTDEYEKLGFKVFISTDDGSLGRKGFVTENLADYLDSRETELSGASIFSCGPIPMLKTLSKILKDRGMKAQISLDQHMCCGIGACFACVHRIRDDKSESGWRYARICTEGPVFSSDDVIFD